MPRPKKLPNQIRVSLGAAVLPEIDKEIETIAIADDRSKSSVIEKLLLRGLAAYRRDGKLTEVEEKEAPFSIPANPFPEFAHLPIVMASDLTAADADARPVAVATPKKG